MFLTVAYMGDTQTVWAQSYSWWAFRGVRIGDTEAKVLTALGEPVEKTQGSLGNEQTTYWKYTVSRPKGNFHVRWLLFDRTGRVEDKVSEFYVD